MPQRSLSKVRPWLYIPADEMTNYDVLAEQQLRQDMIMDNPADILNDAAFRDPTKPAPAVNSPTKRKRNGSTTIEGSPTKRIRGADTAATGASNVTKAAPKKLGRPSKNTQQRHMVNVYPAVEKLKGDVWDPEGISPEKPKPAANIKTQRMKKEASRKGADTSLAEASIPAPKSLRSGTKSASNAAVIASEGAGSAFLNGKIDMAAEDASMAGRSKDQERGSGKSRGRAGRTAASPDRNSSASSVAEGWQEEVHTIERSSPATREVRRKSLKSSQRGVKKNQEISASGLEDHDDVSDDDNDDKNDDDNDENGIDDDDDDFDAPVSGQTEQLEESDDSSSVDSSSPPPKDHDEVSEHHMDLLGQEENWDRVLKEARSVHKNKLASDTIRDLSVDIREARSLYKQLQPSGVMVGEVLDGLKEKLSNSLDTVEEQIKIIEEKNFRSATRSKVIRDIYSRAIPRMVFLTESALEIRTRQPHGLHGSTALEEIIRLQVMTVQLCRKARGWEAKPDTDQPIIKQTSNVILPKTLLMKKVFDGELKKLERQEKARQNALLTARRDKDLFEQTQREADLQTQRSSQQDPRQYKKFIEEEQERLALQKARSRNLRILDVDRSLSDQHVRRPQPMKGHECEFTENYHDVL